MKAESTTDPLVAPCRHHGETGDVKPGRTWGLRPDPRKSSCLLPAPQSLSQPLRIGLRRMQAGGHGWSGPPVEHLGSLRAWNQLRGHCYCPFSIPSIGMGSLEVPGGETGTFTRKQGLLEQKAWRLQPFPMSVTITKAPLMAWRGPVRSQMTRMNRERIHQEGRAMALAGSHLHWTNVGRGHGPVT